MSVLICRNLSLGYNGEEILHNLNFEVASGDYLCIIGENGSGKTTLMKTILGLKKPISGEIITGDGLKQSEIGYLPQQTAVQKDFPATVWEIVLSGCGNNLSRRLFYRSSEKEKAQRTIKELELEAIKNKSYRELSGGQQQRVLLARALCATKKMLLLDEPVSGLDAKSKDEMYKIIKRLNENGITIIMITHNTKEVLDYASHILHIDNAITFFGTKEDYLEDLRGERK